MIIYKCDICKKQVDNAEKLESLVLYKATLDYCENCQVKVNKIKKALERSIKYYNAEKDKQILVAEKNIIRRYTNEIHKRRC